MSSDRNMVLRIRVCRSHRRAQAGEGPRVTRNELMGGAASRAARRAPRFRAAGLWATEAVDLVRDAALRDAQRTAVASRERSLTSAELDDAVNGAVAALGTGAIA